MTQEKKTEVPTTTWRESPTWALGAVYRNDNLDVNDEKKMDSDVDGHGEEAGTGVSRSTD